MRFIKQIYYHFAYLASLFLLISYSYALPNIVLTNCNIIDGRCTPVASDMVVIISDNKIKKIDRGPYKNTIEKGMEIIDLKGGYVLPGFWNNHSHLSDLLPDVNNILGSENTVSATIRAGRNAMDALKRGFTSCLLYTSPSPRD